MTGHAEENSLEYDAIKPSELYPRKQLRSDSSIQIPFPELIGESVEYLDKTSDGVIALSNYRLFVRFKDWFVNRPLGLIESVEYRDIFYIHICCKDGHSFKCTFDTNELCVEWYNRLGKAITPPGAVDKVFAFAFCAHSRDAEEGLSESPCDPSQQLARLMIEAQQQGRYSFDKEVERMQYNLKTTWRITHINKDYKVCQSYPQQHIVPHSITDDDLKNSANFRGGRRFPSVVWRHRKNGTVIARCSQPEMGIWGWRNTEDEKIMRAIAQACQTGSTNQPKPEDSGVESSDEGKKGEEDKAEGKIPRMLIVDARSYPAAVANRAKGGGCECIEYYPNCSIDFMGLANIHAIRKSFHAVRSLCSSGGDQTGWFQGLDTTKWLQHLSSLLRATATVVETLDKKSQAVLIHCSDGWDRTPQISALAQLLLDPYYRTFEGFRVLVEKEWLEYGHKFADRCGLGKCSEDTNERCPVFLQWLDAVHQLLLQFPRAFQFNESYLVKLVQHTYSNLFGTFLCNTVRDREMAQTYEQTGCVWGLLHPRNRAFYNPLYIRDHYQVLEPSYQLKDLQLWRAVYMYKTPPSAVLGDNFEDLNYDEDSSTPNEAEGSQVLTKTRSCENLSAAVDENKDLPPTGRRLSDPSVTISDPSAPSATTNPVLTNIAHGGDAGSTENNDEISSKSETETLTEGSRSMNGHLPNGNIDSKSDTESEGGIEGVKGTQSSSNGGLKLVNGNVEDGSSDRPIGNEELRLHKTNTSIPLENGSDHLPEVHNRQSLPKGSDVICIRNDTSVMYNRDLSTSGGSDVTLVSGAEDGSEIAEGCRISEMNGVSTSINGEGKTLNGDCCPENCEHMMNGHCDTLTTCSKNGNAARNEDENGQTPTQCCDTKCVGSQVEMNENESTTLSAKSHLSNGHSVRTSHAMNNSHHPNQLESKCIKPCPRFATTQTDNLDSHPITNGHSESDDVMTEPITNGYHNHLKFSPGNNIRALRAANMSTSTSDISDSHVSVRGSSFMSGIQKANSLKEEESALAKLELTQEARTKGRWLHLDMGSLSSMGGGGVRRDVSRDGSSSSASNTPSPSTEKNSGSWPYRASNYGLSRYLDVDGLNTVEDPYTSHTLNLHAYYGAILRRQQRVINTLLYHLSSGRNGTAAKLSEDLLHHYESEDEATSLGAASTAASDVSWEQVTPQDADMTLWVPDHVVTHCAGCDSEFWIARRKHHCRNCGQVFCGECAKYYIPVPRQQLKDPVRVCKPCYQAMGGAAALGAMHQAGVGADCGHVALETSTADPESELQNAMQESSVTA